MGIFKDMFGKSAFQVFDNAITNALGLNKPSSSSHFVTCSVHSMKTREERNIPEIIEELKEVLDNPETSREKRQAANRLIGKLQKL